MNDYNYVKKAYNIIKCFDDYAKINWVTCVKNLLGKFCLIRAYNLRVDININIFKIDILMLVLFQNFHHMYIISQLLNMKYIWIVLQ